MAKRIESEKILLRPYQLNEWKAVLKYTSNTELWKYLDEAPFDEKSVRQFIAYCVQKQTERDGFADHIPVILKPNLKIIGHVYFQSIYGKGDIMGIGAMIGTEYQGKGYGTEALKNVIRYAFNYMSVHRIEASCDARNLAAVKMLEKAGLKREGYFRESMIIDDKWQDECVYAILKTEWKK